MPIRIGILGCGVISGIYIENARKLEGLELVAVADVNPTAARYRGDQYGVPRALSPEELLADPDVEIVINLTPNRLHAQLSTKILEAGKHVYSEKPLSVYREDALKLLETAKSTGRRVGNAPDTFLGGAWQTARKAVDDGLIGQPFAGMAVFHGRGTGAAPTAPMRPESATRTPAPGHVSFFSVEGLKYGVIVVFDMGPYYLHALINLLGPVRSVMGATKAVFEEQERFGNRLKTEAPTHAVGLLEFAQGAIVQFLVTSDVYGTDLPHLELYGTEGTLRLPDPNVFPGTVLLRRPSTTNFEELPCHHPYNQDSRGVGVLDMVAAIQSGRPHRAAGEMGAHVVDVITAIHESAESGRRVELSTTCPRPAPLPVGLANWTIDP